MIRSFRRRIFLLLAILALIIGINSVLPLSAGYAESSQIRSAKIEWITPDSLSDGQTNRLFIRKHSDDSETSMQFQINAVLTGQEPHEPGSVRILFPRQIWHERSTYYADGAVMSAGYGGMTFSVPDAPSENSLWHWEEAENGQYAIVNDAAIDAVYDHRDLGFEDRGYAAQRSPEGYGGGHDPQRREGHHEHPGTDGGHRHEGMPE